ARQQLAAQKEVEKLASAIDSASIGGNGFETNVTVSRTAATQNATSFSVDGRGRKVEMRWLGPRNESLAVSVRISTSNVKSATLTQNFLNVNNTGINIEVKCWNGQNLMQC
ncbi:MAG: hypothetical protein HY366_01020, partial [Candidatus Aenigmarchaeota archaeon]|nr:hypothetical protein [Candidatus Aenigmarchaeota archaeon]